MKIAGIYSFGVNEESDGTEEHSREALDRMIVDYNQMFGTDYSTDTWDRYFADVSKNEASTNRYFISRKYVLNRI